jgi:hypothetical protein
LYEYIPSEVIAYAFERSIPDILGDATNADRFRRVSLQYTDGAALQLNQTDKFARPLASAFIDEYKKQITTMLKGIASPGDWFDDNKKHPTLQSMRPQLRF